MLKALWNLFMSRFRNKQRSAPATPKTAQLEKQEKLTTEQETELEHLQNRIRVYNRRIDVYKLEAGK